MEQMFIYMLKACTAGLRNTRFSPLYHNATLYLLCKVTGFIQKSTLFDLLNSKGESDCSRFLSVVLKLCSF